MVPSVTATLTQIFVTILIIFITVVSLRLATGPFQSRLIPNILIISRQSPHYIHRIQLSLNYIAHILSTLENSTVSFIKTKVVLHIYFQLIPILKNYLA